MTRKNIINTALCGILSAALLLGGCSSVTGAAANSADTSTQINTPSQISADASNGTVSTEGLTPGTPVEYESVAASDPAAVEAVDAETLSASISGGFSITGDAASTVTVSGNTYTITAAGEYTLTGALTGNIIVNAPEDAEVTLVLTDTSITCADAAPICVLSADKVTVKAQNGTYNVITDNRASAAESSDDSSEEKTPATGAGAITAYTDLTVSGKGTLVVTGNYNNGIHTTKDLKVKNLTLKVTAADNALKGKDSVTVEGAQIVAIALSGDGIKTDNSDISSKEVQRGTVTITDATVNIYSAGDGISAAYDVVIDGDTSLNISTGAYSEYCSDKSLESSGIKADNSVTVNNGVLYINSTKDAVHANSDVQLENGSYGTGIVNINGGSLVINASDDGIHADTTLNVAGGYIDIKTSREGLEGITVNISGGYSYIYAKDDGINASSGNDRTVTPAINVTGGYVQVTTPSGDTDGIDSNGNYVQTGGYVTVFGGSVMGMNAGSIDADGQIMVTGGSVIAFGGICEVPSGSSVNGYTSSGTSFAAGDYTLSDSDGNVILQVTVPSNTSSMWVASELLESGKDYTFSCNGSTVLSWTQTDGQAGDAVAGGFGGFGGFGGQGGFGGKQGGRGGQGNFGGSDGQGNFGGSDGTQEGQGDFPTDGSFPGSNGTQEGQGDFPTDGSFPGNGDRGNFGGRGNRGGFGNGQQPGSDGTQPGFGGEQPGFGGEQPGFPGEGSFPGSEDGDTV